MSRTDWPRSAKAAARLTAVVVLPLPPFRLTTAIVRTAAASGTTAATWGHDEGRRLSGRLRTDSGCRTVRSGRALDRAASVHQGDDRVADSDRVHVAAGWTERRPARSPEAPTP